MVEGEEAVVVVEGEEAVVVEREEVVVVVERGGGAGGGRGGGGGGSGGGGGDVTGGGGGDGRGVRVLILTADWRSGSLADTNQNKHHNNYTNHMQANTRACSRLSHI